MSGLSMTEGAGAEEQFDEQAFHEKIAGAVADVRSPGDPGPQPEGQPRDESGRFASPGGEEPEEPETSDAEEPEEEPEPAAAEAEPQTDEAFAKALEKFGIDPGTELDPATEKLARAYVESERLRGSQTGELGELRQLIEERLPQEDVDEIDDEPWEPPVDQTAAARQIQSHVQKGQFRDAAIAALNAGMMDVYETVHDAWADEQPGPALRFAAQLERMQLEQQMEQRLAPVREQQATTNFNRIWSQVRREEGREDLEDYSQEIAAIMGEHRELTQALLGDGSPDKLARTIRGIHDMARGRKGATVAQAAPAAAKQVEAESSAAAVEAAVVSATATQGRATSEETRKRQHDEYRQQFKDLLLDNSANVQAGITRD